MAVTTMWNRRCYQYDCETPTRDSDLRCLQDHEAIYLVSCQMTADGEITH